MIYQGGVLIEESIFWENSSLLVSEGGELICVFFCLAVLLPLLATERKYMLEMQGFGERHQQVP